MTKLEQYKVDLKGMQMPVLEQEFELDDQFFIDLDAPEVRQGRGHVSLEVKKQAAGSAFELSFDIEGIVVVQCDRCLDDMEQEIAISDRLMVKLGTEYSEEDDWVTIPEEDGEINVAWYIYEFIVLAIPLKHVHAPGQCNEAMAEKLKEHLRIAADDEDIASVEMEEDEDLESTSQISDPRWNELKKILDNN